MRRFTALVVTVALGLLTRFYPIGWSVYDKSLGDVLYAVAAYLALALVLPRSRPLLTATSSWHAAWPSSSSRRPASPLGTPTCLSCIVTIVVLDMLVLQRGRTPALNSSEPGASLAD